MGEETLTADQRENGSHTFIHSMTRLRCSYVIVILFRPNGWACSLSNLRPKKKSLIHRRSNCLFRPWWYAFLMKQPFDPGITQRYDGTIKRIINRDGSFNVRRHGRRFRDTHLYEFLIRISWPAFFATIFAAFIAVNLLFTSLYFIAGIDGLKGIPKGVPLEDFLHTLFFSVQTLTTVGYGSVAPLSIAANVVVSLEAIMGVLGLAFGAALLYARFSRPDTKLVFSNYAIVAPYQNGTSLQFRIANQRTNALVDLEATVVLMTVEGTGTAVRRAYTTLELERSSILFLPLTWTIVHPIDANSPLAGITSESLVARAAEVMVLIRCFDDTFSQEVNIRYSYRFDEILLGYRFLPAFVNDTKGHLVLDLARMNEVIKA
jgi:inward rectifier potassium channel